MSIKHPTFVQNDTAGSRKETAILLVGTAREFGIHQRSIRTTAQGFWITDELAARIYDEVEPSIEEMEEPVEEPLLEEAEEKPAKKASTPKKTSGNRAEKNTITGKE